MSNNNSSQQWSTTVAAEGRAVLYLRMARAGTGSSLAIERQRAACHRFAERHGLSVICEYADIGKPAQYAYQPDLQQLLSDLEKRRDAAVVLVFDHARLSRYLSEITSITERIRDCGSALVIVNDAERHNEGGMSHEA